MRTRLELSAILNSLCENCYFQPGTNTSLTYPCIVYEVSNLDTTKADNKNYINYTVYKLTHIYKSPSSELREKILDSFDFIKFDRPFKSDGLYHDVYTLYF